MTLDLQEKHQGKRELQLENTNRIEERKAQRIEESNTKRIEEINEKRNGERITKGIKNGNQKVPSCALFFKGGLAYADFVIPTHCQRML